jgi:hypothetical protein
VVKIMPSKPIAVAVPAPTCAFCGKRLRPLYETREVRVDSVNALGENDHRSHTEKTGKIRGFGYLAKGHFCTQWCGWSWAVECIEKGH